MLAGTSKRITLPCPCLTSFDPYFRWLPIMKAYERGTAAYFATPPVNLIYAYRASLTQITQGPVSLQARFQAHKDASSRFKKFAEGLGFRNVPLSEEVSANGMTAVSRFPPSFLPCKCPSFVSREQLYFPEGIVASDIVPRLLKKDVVVAGGIHSAIKGLLRMIWPSSALR